MKIPLKNGSIVAAYRLVIFMALVGMVAVVMPLLTKAQPSVSITVVNNTNGEIRHVFLSPTDQDNWGADQLNEQAIGSGGSATLNVACDGSQIKVIGENQDGCFYYQVVSCASNSTWTINSNAAADCGN